MLPNEFGFGHSVIWLGLGREKALESRNEIDTRPVLVYTRQTKPTEPQVKTENFKPPIEVALNFVELHYPLSQ